MVVHVCNPNTLRSEAGGLQIWSQPTSEILWHNKDAFTLWDINQNGQHGHRNWICWQSQRQQLVQICLVTEQGLALDLKQISGFHKTKSRIENAIIRFPWQSQLGDRLRCSFAAGIGDGQRSLREALSAAPRLQNAGPALASCSHLVQFHKQWIWFSS